MTRFHFLLIFVQHLISASDIIYWFTSSQVVRWESDIIHEINLHVRSSEDWYLYGVPPAVERLCLSFTLEQVPAKRHETYERPGFGYFQQ